ncbi:MAG: 30S ribosomal protein S12 methylthiotransferase RimO [Treponema sp.]|jgi:ribosomal protein S12 methylthiotransferase|nr:30S ribosomal protein S12 methylthiotransferase RimO [Treponema sp.]
MPRESGALRYYLDPLGCVKNQVDAETMMAVLNRAGWEQADDSSGADLIIINSCGFIESAKQESINVVLSYRRAYPDKKILLAGCLAQRYAPELAESLTEADGFFGNADLSLAALAASAVMKGEGRPVLSGNSVGAAAEPSASPAPGNRPLLSLPGSAYVKIAEGCNNRCSFCAIPGIRGPLRSRTIPDILAECRLLLDRGIRELCLIGQDLGSFRADRRSAEKPLTEDMNSGGLPKLLEALSTLKGRFWVRLLYIHPDNFPLPILELCRRDGRFLPYFDIPFQHGSARILRVMNRQGTAESYLGLIASIRAVLPDAVIRSTFLLGFPGETEEDFEALLDFQTQAHLDWAGAFVYSREENTSAYFMKGRVPKRLAENRKRAVEERQTLITQERMDRFIGRTEYVLVEERIDGEEGLYLGRLPCQAPEVDGATVISSDDALEPGAFVRGKIFARAGLDLEVKMFSGSC